MNMKEATAQGEFGLAIAKAPDGRIFLAQGDGKHAYIQRWLFLEGEGGVGNASFAAQVSFSADTDPEEVLLENWNEDSPIDWLHKLNWQALTLSEGSKTGKRHA